MQEKCRLVRGFSILLVIFYIANSAADDRFHIGTIANRGSFAYEHLRYAIDRWNTEHGAHTQIKFSIVSPIRYDNNYEERMCEIMQQGIVAVVLSNEESEQDSQLIKSMCHYFNIPCLSLQSTSLRDSVSDFVTLLGPSRGAGARATSEFLDSMRWTGFLLAYQHGSDLEDLSPLMQYKQIVDTGGRRIHIKIRRLPNNTDDYEPFLKYVKTRLKQTNIIIHSNNITVLYNLLQQARGLNMAEPPFSYVFTNTDLSLLEDFLNNMYGASFHCNITGLQLVKNDPMMKTQLALTSEAVYVVGMSIYRMRELGHAPRQSSIMCDSHDIWSDGRIMNEGIRKLKLRNQLTGDVQFKSNGERDDIMYHGVGRINSQFVKLGNWSEKRGWNFDSRYANRWEFDIDPDSEDLEGLHLRVVVYLEEPFVIKTGENQYEGFCIDLLNEMTQVLKFNYTIIEVQDGTYGIEDESGRWNGIIGALQRHEADLSLSAVTITYSRAEVVDFTLPFMHLGISILLARTSEETDKGSLWTFLEPLSLTVWISLLISYCIVSYSMHILAKFSPYEWYNLERIDERDFENIKNQKNQFTVLNSFWFTMGSLMQQGSDVIPRAAATRLIAVVWWMFTQIIISSYTAQLAAFLTVERMSTPIESTQDLANQQKIRYGVLKSGSTMDFFRESKIPMYERMWSVMESSSPGVFVNSSREGIARVKSGGYAYMMESSMLEYYLERDCELQSIGGLLDSKGYGIALPKGSPLRDILSRTVLQLQERTILEALKNKWWRDRREGPSCGPPPSEKATNSKPQNIFGIFYVLLTGLIVAFLLACGEYCIESRHEAFRLKLTIVGKFMDWYRGNSNDSKQRSKLRNMQLDTAGQEVSIFNNKIE
ncbi:GLutamate Receptor family (AMPA) [Caenorhabditis elegans]|uniref:GLutamate Receptor family (AMPA) n=1 Tax=Caenorhabditis elegans TaxID=6239 RepID=H2KY73_CAEEL|nr:GLutamate Receptor family (AMPA) [Caenorhabditis elegans]CCD61468.1 GLutamate Receptor family (AMPA) [Caenorhabditis elegans]|eukprot:NP_001254127.1 GLutamate Receptor family (AMPA) [Caenorhabditis elegans]